MYRLLKYCEESMNNETWSHEIQDVNHNNMQNKLAVKDDQTWDLDGDLMDLIGFNHVKNDQTFRCSANPSYPQKKSNSDGWSFLYYHFWHTHNSGLQWQRTKVLNWPLPVNLPLCLLFNPNLFLQIRMIHG